MRHDYIFNSFSIYLSIPLSHTHTYTQICSHTTNVPINWFCSRILATFYLSCEPEYNFDEKCFWNVYVICLYIYKYWHLYTTNNATNSEADENGKKKCNIINWLVVVVLYTHNRARKMRQVIPFCHHFSKLSRKPLFMQVQRKWHNVQLNISLFTFCMRIESVFIHFM